jgi:hypothetical protein
MEREGISLDIIENPVSNSDQYLSENQIQIQPSIYDRRHPSIEPISHPDEPPLYESVIQKTSDQLTNNIYMCKFDPTNLIIVLYFAVR